MRKQSILSIAVLLATMGGCSWELSEEYKNYVTEDGRVYFCPPKIEGEGEEAVVKFETIDCKKNEIIFKEYNKKTISDDIFYKCFDIDKGVCKQTDEETNCDLCNNYRIDYLSCQNLIENDFFKSNYTQQSQSSNRKICKKTTPLCKYGNNELDCYEDKVIDCSGSDNPNIKRCGNECIDISLDPINCGECGNKCNETLVPFAKTFDCSESKCLPKTCKTGYHIEINECVKDDIYSCGSINCTLTEGWNSGDCIEGNCIPKTCKTDFHLATVNGIVLCEPDSKVHCGENREECKNATGVKDTVCLYGQCVVYRCEDNYHKTQDDLSCSKDIGTACGSYNNNCNLQAGWEASECVNKECKATKCVIGYHKNSDICEQDSNSNCGENHLICKTAEVCSEGICASKCDNNKTECDGSCYDLKSDISHCGNCETKCISHYGSNATCENGKCVNKCSDGYGDCDGNRDNGCETLLSEFNLKVNASGQCVCAKGSQCGIFYNNNIPLPMCIDNSQLKKNGLKHDERGLCSCQSEYSPCGTVDLAINADTTFIVPKCLKKISDFGLIDIDGQCNCDPELYTACGTINRPIGPENQNITIPLCLKEGSYYTNYLWVNNQDPVCWDWHNHLNHDKGQVCYDFKKDNECYSVINFGIPRSYKKVSDQWSRQANWKETCAQLCNSKETIEVDGLKIFTHKCEPKGTCNQFDSFNKRDHFYFDYGCSNNYYQYDCYN